MTEEQKQLRMALLAADIIELPPVVNKDQIWVRGIALVTKANTRKEYVVVRHEIGDDGKSSAHVINDCGVFRFPIVKVNEVYPYEYVQEDVSYLKTKDDIINFIASELSKDASELKGLTKPKLLQFLKKVLIKRHIKRYG